MILTFCLAFYAIGFLVMFVVCIGLVAFESTVGRFTASEAIASTCASVFLAAIWPAIVVSLAVYAVTYLVYDWRD